MKAEIVEANPLSEETDRLLALQHHDPHSILGAHVEGDSVVVRAFRPDASRIDLIIDGEPPRPMTLVDPAGLFETEVAARSGIFPYQLDIHFPDGESARIRDPYSFLPTLGDFNRWDGRLHMMRTLGSSGVWELFIPGLGAGINYKYEIRTRDGGLLLK